MIGGGGGGGGSGAIGIAEEEHGQHQHQQQQQLFPNVDAESAAARLDPPHSTHVNAVAADSPPVSASASVSVSAGPVLRLRSYMEFARALPVVPIPRLVLAQY